MYKLFSNLDGDILKRFSQSYKIMSKESVEYHFVPKTVSRKKFGPEEDKLLLSLVEICGEGNWDEIGMKMKARNGRQCRDRWISFLSPDANKTSWSPDEDQRIIEKVKEIGPKWAIISKYFNKRTDSMIKNRFAALKRKMTKSEKSTETESTEEETVPNSEPECSGDFLDKIFSSTLFENEDNTVFWYL